MQTFAVRKDLPNGGQAYTGRAAVNPETRAWIEEFDRHLELHAMGQEVGCYRVSHRGVAPHLDQLVLQFVLKWPPGDWLRQCLTECDQWRDRSPRNATKRQVKRYNEADLKRQVAAENAFSERIQSTLPDVERYVFGGKKHFDFGRK